MKVGAKERKYIILGTGILAALALLYVLFAQQLSGDGRVIDTVAAKKKVYRNQLGTKLLEGPYEFYLQQYSARLKGDQAMLLAGDNPNVAKQELQKILTDFAARSGVEISQMPAPQKEQKIEGKLYKISARIVTQCTSDQLIQLLTELRNYNQFLTIDELTISIRNSRTRPNAELRPSLTVSAYIKANENEMEKSGPGA